MVNLEIISVFVFFALVAIWLIVNRKKVEFQSGIVIKRWYAGKELIDKLVTHKRLVSIIGNIGIVISMLASLLGLYLLISFTVKMQQAFAPVLPSVGGFSYPGPIVTIPFWYWIIGIFVIIFFHESMHAIMTRLDKVKLKSYGIMMFLILPIGAFVDPDEKQLRRLPILKKLRIFAAGSFANILLAIVFILASFAFFQNFYQESGIHVTGTVLNTPAYNASLNGTIISVNDVPIKNNQDFSAILGQTAPGSLLNIITTSGDYKIKTISKENSQGSYLGVSTSQEFAVKPFAQSYAPVVEWLNGLFAWLFILNVGVGIANMLPIKPLDGGLIYETIFEKIFKGYGSVLIKITSVVILLLFVMNIFMPTLLKLFA